MSGDGDNPSTPSGREEPTDEQLVAAYQSSGSVPHLNTLFSRHVARVRALVFHMVLNNHDADDITQEVFIRAGRGMDRFKSDSQFTSWLYRIAMNCAKTFLATRARRREESAEVMPEPPGPVADHPDRACLCAEIEAHVQHALEGLSPKLRAAIVLTTFHNLSLGEAARVEGCAVATLYWRVHEARRQLRKLLHAHL